LLDVLPTPRDPVRSSLRSLPGATRRNGDSLLMKLTAYCMLAVLGVAAGCSSAPSNGSTANYDVSTGGNTKKDASTGSSGGGFGTGSDDSSVAPSGDDATVSTGDDAAMDEGGSDAAASGDGSAADDASSTGDDGGTPGSDAGTSTCASTCSGCCDSAGNCNTDGTQNGACGASGAACVDCTGLTEVCTAGACVAPTVTPDSGAGQDSGTNMCNTKICIDPVFDCPLQGCFNGCVNFVCQ
jgi:hypothetical protein